MACQITRATRAAVAVAAAAALAGVRIIGSANKYNSNSNSNSSNNNKKKKKVERKAKVKERFMELWNKMIFPVRRVWVAVSSRVKARKNGAGILKLRDDVQTCEYQDVQVMWEMLSRSESEMINHNPKRRQRPFWRVSVWSNHGSSASFSAKHT
ncbi:hypothetical protein KPL70_021110 [Citrus sinensis]|nr:hypothetical protein KPL70_021110 [Citrus sinensis]